MKKHILVSAIVAIFPVLVWAMPNPASVNCVEQGGELEILKNSSGGEYGMCELPSGERCEEWALFRGECAVVREQKIGEKNERGSIFLEQSSWDLKDGHLEKLRGELKKIEEKIRELELEKKEILKKMSERKNSRQIPEPRICTMEYEPVCATICEDSACKNRVLKTFLNRCVAKNARGVVSVEKGACVHAEPFFPLPSRPIVSPKSECANFPGPDFCDGDLTRVIKKGVDKNGCAIWGCRVIRGYKQGMEQRPEIVPSRILNQRDLKDFSAESRVQKWDRPAADRVLNVRKIVEEKSAFPSTRPWWKQLRWQH